jgi:hypothetical protein
MHSIASKGQNDSRFSRPFEVQPHTTNSSAGSSKVQDVCITALQFLKAHANTSCAACHLLSESAALSLYSC